MVRLVFIFHFVADLLWRRLGERTAQLAVRHYDALSRLDYTALLNRWGTVLGGGSCTRSERRIPFRRVSFPPGLDRVASQPKHAEMEFGAPANGTVSMFFDVENQHRNRPFNCKIPYNQETF